MREILFRGKRVSNGEWVEGSLIKAKAENNKDVLYLIAPFIMSAFDVQEVIPETVGQYTGLTDKNGQKIFENDIVINDYYFEKDKTKNSIIIYGEWNCSCCHGVFGWICDGYGDFRDDDVTIIGNIYDNPELLGDK